MKIFNYLSAVFIITSLIFCGDSFARHRVDEGRKTPTIKRNMRHSPLRQEKRNVRRPAANVAKKSRPLMRQELKKVNHPAMQKPARGKVRLKPASEKLPKIPARAQKPAKRAKKAPFAPVNVENVEKKQKAVRAPKSAKLLRKSGDVKKPKKAVKQAKHGKMIVNAKDEPQSWSVHSSSCKVKLSQNGINKVLENLPKGQTQLSKNKQILRSYFEQHGYDPEVEKEITVTAATLPEELRKAFPSGFFEGEELDHYFITFSCAQVKAILDHI